MIETPILVERVISPCRGIVLLSMVNSVNALGDAAISYAYVERVFRLLASQWAPEMKPYLEYQPHKSCRISGYLSSLSCIPLIYPSLCLTYTAAMGRFLSLTLLLASVLGSTIRAQVQPQLACFLLNANTFRRTPPSQSKTQPRAQLSQSSSMSTSPPPRSSVSSWSMESQPKLSCPSAMTSPSRSPSTLLVAVSGPPISIHQDLASSAT